MTHDRSRGLLERFARQATEWAGSSWAFGVAILTIVIWLTTGPIFHYDNTWQLVINTGTTIVTFLMVFLIQRSQNKDSLAVHLKLNELVAATAGASNRLIKVEDLSEQEIQHLRQFYQRLVELARHDGDITTSHTIEDATHMHGAKRKHRQQLRA